MGPLSSLVLAIVVCCCCQNTCWALKNHGAQASLNSSNSENNIGQRINGVEDACEDISTNCHANKDQCLTNNFVKKNCRKTCGSCDTCDDISRNCHAHKDQCLKNDYVQKKCRKTCGSCDACEDISTNCHANKDQCLTNDFVKKNCRKTCGSCDACEDISTNCHANKDQCLTNDFVKKKCRKTCESCGCGVVKPVSRILGGHDTAAHQYPWMASIFHQNDQRWVKCGGSVISNNWILTAAHCFNYGRIDRFTIDDAIVLLGHHNLHKANMKYKPKRLIRHCEYRPISDSTKYASHANDIALLELEVPIQFSETISPVCLPAPDKQYINVDATVTGYGDLTAVYGRDRPHVLKEVQLKTISNSKCKHLDSNYTGIPTSMLCAWHPAGGKDTCPGDSGGPLITLENNLSNGNQYVQIGIVSGGPHPCGQRGKPGFYTRVSKYLSWIENNTAASNTNGYKADVYTRKY